MIAGGAAQRVGDALFAEAIAETRRTKGQPCLVSLSGPQGSGKTTRAAAIARRLEAAGHRVLRLALDDFYLARADRERLAARVHPLLAVRGVPGTHDIDLLERVLDARVGRTAGEPVAIPRFDKLADDRLPESGWETHEGPVDVVLIEGWCVGARPQSEAALVLPVNALERNGDPDGDWRAYVNARLASDYAALFARLDLSLMFAPDDFDRVLAWRLEQEAGLARRAGPAGAAMDQEAVERFVAHYERLTRWMLADEPADLIADLDERRVPVAWRQGRGARRDGYGPQAR